jgi:hypothetical protein
VKSRTGSKADDPVGTSGLATTYMLRPRANVALAPHVGKQVQISAVMLDPGEDDTDVKIKDKTTVDPEGKPDKTTRTETKIEIEDVPHGEYTVVAVKKLAEVCVP